MRENAPIDFKAVKGTSEECGCRVGMLVTGRLYTEGGLSLLDDDKSVQSRAMDGMKKYIDMAAELGAGVVLGWAKGKVPPGADRKAYMDRLGSHLAALGEYAGQAGVLINVEVINRYETNIFVNAAEIVEFFNTYPAGNCMIHLDTFHMGIEETDPLEAIRACRGRLGYIHFADNTRRYPGTGTFDFEAIIKTLAETNYDGLLSVECLPWPDNIEAAKRAISHLKDIVKRVKA